LTDATAPPSLHDARPISLFLDDLFLAPHARGAGVGSALIRRLHRIAQEEGLLEVRWITSYSNTDAQRLYERLALRAPFHTYIDRSEEHTSELQSRENLVC